MIIKESSKYKQTLKRNIINKHKKEELTMIQDFIGILETYPNLHMFMISQYKIKYHVEQKKQNLKELFTARINKIRLIFKPCKEYPYEYIEIEEIELEEVNDDHYKRL